MVFTKAQTMYLWVRHLDVECENGDHVLRAERHENLLDTCHCNADTPTTHAARYVHSQHNHLWRLCGYAWVSKCAAEDVCQSANPYLLSLGDLYLHPITTSILHLQSNPPSPLCHHLHRPRGWGSIIAIEVDRAGVVLCKGVTTFRPHSHERAHRHRGDIGVRQPLNLQ